MTAVEEVADGGVVLIGNMLPLHALLDVLFLLQLQAPMNDEMMQLLVGVVDD